MKYILIGISINLCILIINVVFYGNKISKNQYQNLMLVLAKKNYINKLFPKENIKNNKINLKLRQFFGIRNEENNTRQNNDNNKDTPSKFNEKNNIQEKEKKDIEVKEEKYDNGLEVNIKYEEKEEFVKVFENEFLKSL